MVCGSSVVVSCVVLVPSSGFTVVCGSSVVVSCSVLAVVSGSSFGLAPVSSGCVLTMSVAVPSGSEFSDPLLGFESSSSLVLESTGSSSVLASSRSSLAVVFKVVAGSAWSFSSSSVLVTSFVNCDAGSGDLASPSLVDCGADF